MGVDAPAVEETTNRRVLIEHIAGPKRLLCGLIPKDSGYGLYVVRSIYTDASMIGNHNMNWNSVFKQTQLFEPFYGFKTARV